MLGLCYLSVHWGVLGNQNWQFGISHYMARANPNLNNIFKFCIFIACLQNPHLIASLLLSYLKISCSHTLPSISGGRTWALHSVPTILVLQLSLGLCLECLLPSTPSALKVAWVLILYLTNPLDLPSLLLLHLSLSISIDIYISISISIYIYIHPFLLSPSSLFVLPGSKLCIFLSPSIWYHLCISLSCLTVSLCGWL